jgi:beta-xylosidase
MIAPASIALVKPKISEPQYVIDTTSAVEETPDQVFYTSSQRLRPAIEKDFADPSIIQGPDGWYAFATSRNGIHVQSAYSKDFSSWTVRSEDAMPRLPRWVNAGQPAVWAPDVIRNVSF